MAHYIVIKRSIMSEDKNVVTLPEKKDNGKKAKKSDKKSIGWIIGVAILILISVSFVLPTTLMSGSQSGAISFGKYDGNSIELSANSYFYYQLNSIYSYYVQNYGEATANSASYNIYYSAFQQALVNEAFQSMAEKAGFKATSSQITDAVINSGYFSDGTNIYSSEVYKNASDMQKKQIVDWMEEYVPFEEVENTILSAPISKAEENFIANMSKDTRNIEYIPVTGVLYPNEDALSYAQEREELFHVIDFTRATYATSAEATNAYTLLLAGSKTMEEAVTESIDTSFEDGGKIENAYRYMMDNYLSSISPDSAEELYSAEVGAFVGPIQTSEGYTIFRIDTASYTPDFTDEDVLLVVKSYIASNDSEAMKAYLDTVIDEIYKDAQKDFEGAAAKWGLQIGIVSSVAENTGDSQYVYSYNYTSENASYTGSLTNGYLYTASTDNPEWNEKLYSSDYGTVLEPVFANNAYVIARPEEGTSDSYMSSLLGTMYTSSASQNTLFDFESTIVTSDKVEDNFINGFLQAAYGVTTSTATN